MLKRLKRSTIQLLIYMEDKFKYLKNVFKILLILIITISCKEKKIEVKHQLHEKILSFVCPDTVQLDQIINASIIYNTELDSTINLSDIDERTTYLHLTIQDTIQPTLGEIKKSDRLILKDTIGDGLFKFRLKFKTLTNNVLNIGIEDIIFFKPQENDKVRIKTHEVMVSKNVFIKAFEESKNL